MEPEPLMPVAEVVQRRYRSTWPHVIAGIGLFCALLPFHCSVHVGSVQQEWGHGGALFGGVIAMLFAGYALLRQRGGRGAIALVAFGAVVALYGYFTIERLYSGPAMMPAVNRILMQVEDHAVDEVIAEADPGADKASLRRALETLVSAGAGWSGSNSYHYEYGPDGLGTVIDEHEGDHHTLVLDFTFRPVNGIPRLLSLYVVPPDAPR
jgi:hypothetical protein